MGDLGTVVSVGRNGVRVRWDRGENLTMLVEDDDPDVIALVPREPQRKS
jgi:hypothetical protein